MDVKELSNRLKQHPEFAGLVGWLNGKSQHLKINGLSGSAAALWCHIAQKAAQLPAVYILHDAEEAGYFYGDLCQLSNQNVYYFPSSYKKKIKDGLTKDAPNQVLRTEALGALQGDAPVTLVTYPEALTELVIAPSLLSKETLQLKVGNSLSTDYVVELLTEYGFKQTDFVYEPGQFSVRGSLIDVFSFSNDIPYRIDFFGDDIDSIRSFDIESQLSIESLNEISIVSSTVNSTEEDLVPVFQFFKERTILGLFDAAYCLEAMSNIAKQNPESPLFITVPDMETCFSPFRCIEWGLRNHFGARKQLHFNQGIQPIFHKNFDLVAANFVEFQNKGYEVLVCSDNPKQIERLKDIFEDRPEKIGFTPVINIVHEGFIDHDLKMCVYTDHQIFERYHKYSLKSTKTRAGKVVMSLKELMQIQVGDYIVHQDHGVGRFGGLIRLNNDDKVQEFIKLTFKDNDIILVNIHSLHCISKYKSKDGEPPKLNKLGTAAWSNLKDRTKKKVKDIARELIALYAKRKAEQGFAYSPDSYLQQELESSFLYEDTPDQAKATVMVKRDMESTKPMDRLICGDVGFGKTEIAMRAAFKAACDSKQVAVLVPTTVLAFQHYKSFSKRLKRFPCRVEYLSRARKTSDVKEITEDLASGKIDILIGTHKLLSKSLKFKDLGLLIIDEEQKFGVAAKEKLKQVRANIDTLTLTATPIPRTLQFSLMGARDLSIISTPPPNRYPIQTELLTWDDDTIKEAIEFEISRGGQIFFVNNRINNLPDLESRIRRLVPQARICIGHGQMDSEKLEEIILNFINYEYDILLATSIIESGIDIPNVNTMFINDAQNFGLSDLHQLRGRVGRTNKKAFCYLIAPPLSGLSPDSRRRLQAIENFSDLGSGIHIAMQDLDIRGAGNILGGEQSGFIADLGYETYHRILDEAIGELKHHDFAELFAEEIAAENTNFSTDCLFESDLELLLPATYVESVSERIQLYRRLDGLKTEEELTAFEAELKDRFGELPQVVKELIQVVRLRHIGMRSGIEKMTLRKGKLTAYLLSNFESNFYQSEIFNKMLVYAVENPRNTLFKEENGKRTLTLLNIGGVQEAYDCFMQMQ
jgi:transcription-repair coupling factor (superfamily II helicase)